MLDLLMARKKAAPCLIAIALVTSGACGARSAQDAELSDSAIPNMPNNPNDPGGPGDGDGDGPGRPGPDGSTGGPFPTDPVDDGSEYLFDQNELRTFELTLSSADLAFLDADPMAEQYVPGSLTFEGEQVSGVGIRYKGSVGSFTGCLSGSYFPPSGSKSCPKLSMKVKIDHADPDAKFHGMKKLLFHAMNLDPSLFRERLGYELFNEMGVHSPRAVHVRLLVNGKFAGLFLLVEEIDGRFTRRRFEDGGKGNLYKEAWPSVLDAEVYRSALETNRNDNPSVEKILAFAKDLASANDTSLPKVLADWIDEDYIARFVAVDRTIKHDDGPYHWYCDAASADFVTKRSFAGTTCGNHNFFWYEDTRAQRVWPVPWDLDNAMANSLHYVTIANNWDDLSASCSSTVSAGFGPRQMPGTCDPFTRGVALSFPERVRSAMAALRSGPFSESAVNARFDAWKAQIGPVVDEAYAADGRQLSRFSWELELGLLQSTLSRLRATVQ